MAGDFDHVDFVGDELVVMGFRHRDIDDHIDFIGSEFDGALGLKDIDVGERGSERESDHRANFD